MQKLKMHTVDRAEENYKKLCELFPNAITETINEDGEVVRAIDADVLRQEISSAVVEGSQERYQFTWPDKKRSVVLANQPIAKTLRLDRSKSVGRDGTPGSIDTENIYIEGDNLDALKLLQETYLGKVKMIYIDPPYNTGNDFVYEDDFSQSADIYIQGSGQLDEQGNRLVQNTESNGRFHTDWLNMLYPRLRIARDLLTDDGVIFISIDDNEQENLKKICDEIFGNRNYINQFVWVSNITGRQIAGYGAAKTWESILAYGKNVDHASSLSVNIQFAKNNMPDSYKGFKKDIRVDNIGEFAIGDTLYNHNRKFNEATRPNLVFSIFYNPETEEIKTGNIGETIDGFVELTPHKNGDGIHKYHAWRWSRKKIENESFNLIVLPNSSGGYEIYTRIRDFNTTLLKDIITNISNGDSELQKLFDNKKYFDYPKSVSLLKLLINSLSDKEITIIDFFSGSATTAHAVMQLNAEDGGNRKFIMVQLPEVTDEKSEARKAGYETICDIGEERIRRAGKRIREEIEKKQAKSEQLTLDNNSTLHSPHSTLDTGFRVFRVDSSNMENVYYAPADFDQTQLEMFADNIKPDRTPEDLLFQVMLDLGIMLSSEIEETEIDGKKVFIVGDKYEDSNGNVLHHLVACFDNDITEETVKAIAKMQPFYAVFRDSGMASDSVATNFEQIFETYSPKTVRRVL